MVWENDAKIGFWSWITHCLVNNEVEYEKPLAQGGNYKECTVGKVECYIGERICNSPRTILSIWHMCGKYWL